MQSHRIISALTIFMMVALVAVGYFLVAQPQLAAASAAGTQLVDAQSQISSAQATLLALKNDQKKLPALKAQLAGLQQSVPSNIDGSAYIRGLNDLASAAGVTITTLAVDDPQAYVPPVTQAPVAAATTATPAPSASAAPAAAATTPAVTGWTPTTDPLITATNFVDIPVTVTVTGSFDQSLTFIHGLQTGTRLFLVTGITTKPDDTGTGVTASITGYIYALIDPQAAAKEAAAEKAPAATPTPTATPSSTASPSSSATPTPTPSSTPTKKP